MDIHRISIIVPVFEAEKYLSRCIDSVSHQTFSNYELIFVDDGSIDRCGAICDEYLIKDSRVFAVHRYNSGQASARNKGICLATGEYISFVDADDCIHPQYLEILVEGVTGGSRKISACAPLQQDTCPESFFSLISSPHFHERKIHEEELMELFQSPYICWIVCGKLFPEWIVRKYPFTDGRVYEDNAIVVRWLFEVGEISYTELQLYFYQNNTHGTTKSPQSVKKRLDWIWALSEQMSFFKDSKMSKLLANRFPGFFYYAADSFFELVDVDMSAANEVIKLLKPWWIYAKKNIKFSLRQKLSYETIFYPFLLKLRQVLKEIHLI